MTAPDQRRHAPGRVLALVAGLADGPAAFGALRARLGVAASVAARLLHGLEAEGWVRRAADGRWEQGPACAVLRPGGGRLQAARAVLDGLRDASGCTALLVARDDGCEPAAVRCVAKAVAEDGLIMQPEGALRVHWLSHPWSWCFLAALPARERDRRIAQQPDAADLLPGWRRAAAALAAGTIVVQTVPTATRLALAVRAEGRQIAALGLGIPGARPPAALRRRAEQALVAAAPAMAAALGGQPPPVL